MTGFTYNSYLVTRSINLSPSIKVITLVPALEALIASLVNVEVVIKIPNYARNLSIAPLNLSISGDETELFVDQRLA